MLPENRAFRVRGDDGEEYGPVGLEELRDWVAENRAGLGTEVRLDESGSLWQPWQYYPELVALLAEVRVTSPVPGVPGLVIAKLWRRIMAFALDLILVSFLVTPVFFTLALVCTPDWFVKYIIAASQPTFTMPEIPLYPKMIANLISDSFLALYMAGFLAAHGQTPAKAILRLRVVDQNGRKLGFARSLFRTVVLIFSMGLFFIPLAYAFFNPERRAFHDYVAGTYVVEA